MQRCINFITQSFFIYESVLGVTPLSWAGLIKGIYKVLLVESSTGSEFIIHVHFIKPQLASSQALPAIVRGGAWYILSCV